jgi:N-acetylneuraminic acid mutarotase
MRYFVSLLLALAWSGTLAGESRQTALSFEDRVTAQKAIEQVYWKHRIWPKENPAPKPPLSATMPDSEIRAKVEDYLKKSNALEASWKRPVTPAQLQAEMNRMATQTRDGQVLSELFAALGNDPLVIAETLARQTLVQRLIHAWYENDGRSREAPTNRAPFEVWWGIESRALGTEIPSVPFTFSLITPAVGGCTDDTWKPTAAPMEPRELHTAIWTGAEMIVWGGEGSGIGGSVYLNTGGRYTPSTDTWIPTSIEPGVPGGRSGHTAVWTGTEMIVWGGYNGTIELNSGGRYNPVGDSWIATASGAGVPDIRRYHTAVWTGSEMIVWGGSHFDQYTFPKNTGGRYNPVTDTWIATSVGAGVPEARLAHTAVWTGAEMIVWGGVGGITGVNTGGRYNPSSDTWTPTSMGLNLPEQRGGHSAVWTGSEMIVWGGDHVYSGSSHYLNTGGRYSPSSDTWSPTSTGAGVLQGRVAHSAVWTGTEMVIWGGYRNFTYFSDGARYNPGTGMWTQTSTSGAPDLRFRHTAVWTGTEMIVWGGDRGVPINTGGRYQPSTDSWVATSTGAYAPADRRRHTAIWTGAEMIVWGGWGNQGELQNTGGRYSPATDSWTATSTGVNVPDAREQHVAVWTGSEMIVFGGSPYAVTDSGGRYNPSTDTWVPTSAGANVPGGRFLPSAVWTGTEMIVWGGHLDATELNTGARYNPAANSWVKTSTGPSVPSGRHFHTAIWTGSRMVIWGGYGGTDLNTGGRYDPSTNTWSTTSTGANVPSPREQHAAVWTGTEMIVWGGQQTGPLNTGARYDPSTDAWVPTPLGASVPAARLLHSAVWTGSEMIVWGGTDSTNGFSMKTGGRFNPALDAWTASSIGSQVPADRQEHTAVWTASEMIVWGGGGQSSYTLNTGARYCACMSPSVYYRDLDGDGHGDPSVSTTGCNDAVPTGYVVDNTDCNDAAANVWSVSSEVLGLGFTTKTSLGWIAPTEPGGTAPLYDVVRGALGAFPVGPGGGDEVCFDNRAGTTLAEPALPNLGSGFWYLARGQTSCGSGTFGTRSDGSPRTTATCP